MIQRLLKLLTPLGVNAIPALGWLFGGWTSGTTLVVYWFESIASAAFIALKILLHARWTNHRGHVRYVGMGQKVGEGGQKAFFNNYLPIALVFNGAHGFFLLIILVLLAANGKENIAQVNPREVVTSCGIILLLLLGGFLMDLPSLKKKPFAWIEVVASRNFQRMAVMHLTLIFGLCAVAVFANERAFFLVFIILKTLNDLSTTFPQWEPEKPPRWLSAVMNKIPSAQKESESFEEFWVRDRKADRDRQAANEAPVSNR